MCVSDCGSCTPRLCVLSGYHGLGVWLTAIQPLVFMLHIPWVGTLQEPISNNAYMLVYERVVPQQPDIVSPGAGGDAEPSTPMSPVPATAMIRLDREVCI